ncbi:hypothetical protein [Janthinobacterium sp. UMAB-56]|nr:hypothetical protein [Janthinobacterium sp. UMAB-56]
MAYPCRIPRHGHSHGADADHIVSPYRALIESYDKAKGVQKNGRET